MSESIVTLDDALVGALTRRAGYVSVHFPHLSLHMRGWKTSAALPTVEAEIRIWDGTVEQTPRRLPRRLTRWRVDYRSGGRSTSLPLSFSASGDVRLQIEFADDDPLLIAGSRITLRVRRRYSQLSPTRSRASGLLSKDMARKRHARSIPQRPR